MRLARFDAPSGIRLAVGDGHGWMPVSDIPGFEGATRLTDLLGRERLNELARGLERRSPATAVDLAVAAPVVDGGDIWGAGLNYVGHSRDLDAAQPTSGPGSYLRPRNCLIGNGGAIRLPTRSARVTAEAELGLVVGTDCRDVDRHEWRLVVAGVTAVLDMTAEDAIRENPRHIPWAKGFDTFCSVGPQLVTLDEFDDGDLKSISVSTVRNGDVVASAPTADMKYDIGFLVEYFTAGRTIPAGTVICTGTPGATVITPGDFVQSVVDGVGTLSHTVVGDRAGSHE